jgi:hypothetical protein
LYAELSALIKKWYPNVKFGEHIEKQPPKPWPKSVKEFCSIIPLDVEIWNCQDTILFHDRVEEMDGLFRFMIENQGVVTWYFETKDDDPITYVDSVDETNIKIPQPKFSELIGLLFYQNLKFRASEYMLWGFLETKERNEIKNTYSEYYRGQVYWPGQDTSIYDCGEFVIEFISMNEDEGYVYVSCINEEIVNCRFLIHTQKYNGNKKR